MSSPAFMSPSWRPWPIRRYASGSPTWARESGLASNRRQRRSPPSKRPRSRSGGRSSRRRTSRRNEMAVKLPRRQFLHLAAGAAAVPAMSRIAWAQAYPTRPVRWIVGFAPGGGNDIVARLMGQWLSERTGQQFIIENRPGAGTNVATEAVVNASPDRYTLLLVGLPNASNATLFAKLNLNFNRD